MNGEIGIEESELIHRIGGGSVENLSLKPEETQLNPPGISTLRGGTPAEAAAAMRRRFPRMAIRGETVVGSSTAGQIRSAGFDVIMDATKRFPQHARLIHPDGVAGFSLENLNRLSKCFTNHFRL
jgi:anthranilate phosphoribosyltransferase